MTKRETDAEGKNSQQRFLEIREHFLAWLKESGQSRMELYYRPKPGELREPTEEEVVRHWAESLAFSVNDILIGIGRAFEVAGERGQVVTSFRFCVPHIVARLNEMRGSRVGE